MITLNDLYTDKQYKEMDLFTLFDLINSDKISGETFKQLVGSTMRDKVRNLYMRLHPNMIAEKSLNDIQLDKVVGNSYCQYSVIENQLEILYKNQEKILQAIKLAAKKEVER